MNKKLQYLLYLLGLVLLVFVFIQIRSYYKFIKSPVAQLPEAFPVSTLGVLGAANAADFIETSRASGLAEVLTNPEGGLNFEQFTAFGDSLGAEDDMFRNLLEKSNFMSGFVPDSTGAPGMLFAFNVGKLSPEKFTRHCKAWAKTRGIDFSKTNHPGVDFYTLCKGKTCINYYVHKGLLCLSTDRNLLISSIEALTSKNNLMNDAKFMALAKTSGKKVDASLIIRTPQLISMLLSMKPDDAPADVFSGGWTTFDLTIRKDRLLVNGFTGVEESPLFSNEIPLPVQITGIQNNTPKIYGFLLGNLVKSIEDRLGVDTIHAVGYDSANNKGSHEIFRFKEHLISWQGNYFFRLTSRKNQDIIVIENKQSDSTAFALSPFLEPQEAGIAKFTDNRLYKELYGNLFDTGIPVYCYNAPPILAFSSSLPALRQYIHSLNDPGVNDESNAVPNLVNNAQEKANFFLMRVPVTDKSNEYNRWNSWLQRCSLVTLKISAGEPYMYSSGAIYFEAPKRTLASLEQVEDTTSAIEQPIETQAYIPSDLTFAPIVISGSKAGEMLVAFFGKNTLSIHDYSGKQVLEWQSPEPLTGQVFTTGFTQTGQPRYIVIGQHNLYQLSAQGSLLKKLPLPEQAAGPAGFFDYDRKKDYRIVYHDTKGTIYSLNTEGKVLPDWQKPQHGKSSVAPVFIRNASKDYLFFGADDGNLLITDRRGRERIKVYEGFKKSAQAGIYENRTNAKGMFITAAADGRLAYISSNGIISYSSFGHFGDHPYFEYADFDGDGSMDFMFAGKEKLSIYTRMKKSIVALNISGGSLGKPFMYASSLGKSWVAVRDTRSGKVHLMNSKGEQVALNDLRSDTDPVIFNPGGSRQIVLVTSQKSKPVFTPLK